MKKPAFLIAILCLFCMLTACSNCPYYTVPYIETSCQAPPPKPLRNVQVAVALSTGGFNGTAHLGVLEILEKEGIPIDLIVGCSAGSIMGAFYCDHPHSLDLKKKLSHLKHSDFIDPGVPPYAGRNLERFLAENLSARNFEELKIPLVAVTTNLDNNKVTLLRSGPIPPAVHASSAIPGIFKPVLLYCQHLADGGILHPVPAKIARSFHPKLVIAVNIVIDPPPNNVKNSRQVRARSIDLSYNEFSELKAAEADIVIHPLMPLCDSLSQEINIKNYEIGKKAAQAAIPEIKRKMQELNIPLKHKNR